MSKEETIRRINRAIDQVRDQDPPLGHAFQEVITTPERLSAAQLDSLEKAVQRVLEILKEYRTTTRSEFGGAH